MTDNSSESLTLEVLEVAIGNLRNSLGSMSQNDPEFCSTATLLAHALRKQYLLLRPHDDLSALEQSIAFMQQALDGFSINDPRRAECLINLAFCLSLRCDATESETDAIE